MQAHDHHQGLDADDDGPYIAATPLETALIIGLPFCALVALCIAAWNGIEAVRAWLGA
jgi:hypothetical protein